MILNHVKYFMPSKEALIKTVIHMTAIEGSAVGLSTAQIPGDRLIIGGIKIYILIVIAAEFGHSLTKAGAQSLFYSTIWSSIGPKIANQLLKYFPGIGNIINGSAACSITEIIDWAAVEYYRNLNN